MMETYSGKEVDPLWIKPDDITLEDYVRALSMSCRFGGHVTKFYSVLNHCLNMSQWFYDQKRYREAKYAAFHEGDEVFFGDIITPIKYLDVFAPVREIIKDTQRAVYKQFKLYGAEPKSIKKLDDAMKILEAKKVKPNSALAQMEVPDEYKKVKMRILSQKRCEEEFLALIQKIDAALAS